MRGLLRDTRRAEVLDKLVFVSAVVALSALAATMRVLVLLRLTVSKRLGGPFVPSQGRQRRACKLHQAGRAALMALIVQRSDSSNAAIVPCALHTAGDLQQL